VLQRRWRVRAGATAVERSGELVYLAPSGELFRTDGERVVVLVDATRLVADPRVLTSLADGSVSVVGTRRLAIFSPAGRLTASAGAASGRMDIQEVSAAPDGRGYAYVRTIRRARGGTDRSELLVLGDRAPRTLAANPGLAPGMRVGLGGALGRIAAAVPQRGRPPTPGRHGPLTTSANLCS
jgi:hypothetical protein